MWKWRIFYLKKKKDADTFLEKLKILHRDINKHLQIANSNVNIFVNKYTINLHEKTEGNKLNDNTCT